MGINVIEKVNTNGINMQSSNKIIQNQNESTVVKTDETTKKEEYDDKKEEYNDNKENLDNALKKLNKFLEDDKVHAEYSVHKDLGNVMIKIVNDNTKEVIMEVPSGKILDMVASMCKQFGLLDRRA